MQPSREEQARTEPTLPGSIPFPGSRAPLSAVTAAGAVSMAAGEAVAAAGAGGVAEKISMAMKTAEATSTTTGKRRRAREPVPTVGALRRTMLTVGWILGREPGQAARSCLLATSSDGQSLALQAPRIALDGVPPPHPPHASRGQGASLQGWENFVMIAQNCPAKPSLHGDLRVGVACCHQEVTRSQGRR
jgi:hypothetical protein